MRKGFTLIELMIVVLVIGILAAIGISKYQSFVMESRQKSCMSQLKGIDQALGVWETKNVGFNYDNIYATRFWANNGINTGRLYGQQSWNPSMGWINTTGIMPINDDILRIVNDKRMFSCPELLNKYGNSDIPQDWRQTYRWIKVQAPGAGTWEKNWVPDAAGRATTCFSFGYFNSGNNVTGAWWGWITPPTQPAYAPGWGGIDHTRNFIHLQWGGR